MNLKERAMAGVFGGIAATLVLSALREALTRFGLVFETAPMQVVNRMQEVGLVEGSSSEERRGLTVAAHFAYGMGPEQPSASCAASVDLARIYGPKVPKSAVSVVRKATLQAPSNLFG